MPLADLVILVRRDNGEWPLVQGPTPGPTEGAGGFCCVCEIDSGPLQQPRQLGDVGGDAPGLVAGEQVGR